MQLEFISLYSESPNVIFHVQMRRRRRSERRRDEHKRREIIYTHERTMTVMAWWPFSLSLSFTHTRKREREKKKNRPMGQLTSLAYVMGPPPPPYRNTESVRSLSLVRSIPRDSYGPLSVFFLGLGLYDVRFFQGCSL